MPDYLTPGVYIEELPTGTVPIEGVSTSTVGMVGRTQRGPTAPRLVGSWLEFTRLYGGLTDPAALGYLAWGVQGFFANGGKRAYIARVAGMGAAPAILVLGIGAGADGGISAGSFTIRALGPGDWGNRIAVRVGKGSLAQDGGRAAGLFSLTVLYFDNTVSGAFVDPTVPANRASPAFREPAAQEFFDNLSADPASPAFAPTVINAASSLVSFEYAAPDKKPPSLAGLPVRLAVTLPAGAPAGDLASLDSFGTPAVAMIATSEEKAFLRVRSVVAGVAGNSIKVAVVNPPEGDAGAAGTFSLEVTAGAAPPKPYRGLTPQTAAAQVNAASPDIRLEFVNAQGQPAVPAAPAGGKTALSGGKAPTMLKGGVDGEAPTAFDYSGDNDHPGVAPEKRTGLAGLATIRDIALLAVPDQDETRLPGLTNLIVAQCETLRDRFCILQFEQSVTSPTALLPPMDTSYGAIYYPWINTPTADGRGVVATPPAGHIAGVFARTDIERGVFKAPANEVLRGVLARDIGDKGPLVSRVTEAQQGVLNPRGVNCLRDFRAMGRDVRVWGARTMSSSADWKYVNVRRLFIMIEQSVERGVQWVVFEPNDAYTWNRVVSSVSAYLTTLWRNGALFGATPQEAFFVRCDATTMTPDDVDNGRLICYVGVAPVKPAEFVIFRFSQKTAMAAG